jgi:hypothetical protein
VKKDETNTGNAPELKARFHKESDAERSRHSRYSGLQKTHLQEVATAAAINIVRTVNFLNHQLPAKTRVSRFARLAN